MSPSAARDAELIQLEGQLRVAIRDAVNRPSRKPFAWGGLTGYDQMAAIAQVLTGVPETAETHYLRQLKWQVDRVVEQNRVTADDLRTAHTWLRRIAECLRYPPDATTAAAAVTSVQVQQEMAALRQAFAPDLKRQPAQAALYGAWQRTWRAYGPDLLPCYDIPGLPPDNLRLESLFGRLRRHQRRISGRKTTRELRDFGQSQVLFSAESEEELLAQIRQVPLEVYQQSRRRLEEAQAPHRFLRRLHRDPLSTVRRLIDQHAARRAKLDPTSGLPPP